jgi:signal transduction histidine kinase
MASLAAGMKAAAGQGSLSVQPVRRTGLVAGVAVLWVVLQLALVIWWAIVISRQARHIAQLEALQGLAGGIASEQWSRTRLMLVGESSSFFALLLAISLLLAWLYWREHRRARAMQAFFASVTHELRTPLTSIRLQAEAIAEGDHSAELARRLLEDSHRLESQIDQTLELARIEGGGPLSEQAVPLQSWVPRALESIRAAYGDRVMLDLQIDAALPPVQADAAALQMILRNLVDNSVRHSRRDPVKVRVHAEARDQRVALDYQDNGIGTERAAAHLGRLFARGPGSSGAGVGLYLVRRLMQRMGGTIRFMPAGEGFRCELLFQVSS